MDDVLAKVDVPRRRFTVDEYYRMGEVGILTETDRVELIDSDIIQMSPMGPRHGTCVAALNEWLVPAVVGRAVLRPRLPLLISSHTQPEPDVLLLVEVTETSYAYDRNVKLPLYARENIPEVWLIDLVRGAVEVYREPSPRGYRSLTRLERGATLTPAAFPDVAIAVMEILPPA